MLVLATQLCNGRLQNLELEAYFFAQKGPATLHQAFDKGISRITFSDGKESLYILPTDPELAKIQAAIARRDAFLCTGVAIRFSTAERSWQISDGDLSINRYPQCLMLAIARSPYLIPPGDGQRVPPSTAQPSKSVRGWAPSRIRQALKQRGITQCDLAAVLGCDRGSISNVISRNARSKRVETHIAALLGEDRLSVFGPNLREAAMLHVHPAHHHLTEAGLTQKELARRIQVHPVTISQLLSGRMKSARIEALIAAELGVPRGQLFDHQEGQ